MRTWVRVVAMAAACLLAAWSLVPLSLWWEGAERSYYSAAWQTWLWGSAVAALLIAGSLAVTRGRAPAFALRAWHGVMAIPPRVFVLFIALVLALLTVLATLLVFDGNPRNVDGFAQLFQARIFLAGRLFLTPPPELASFATLQMILGPDKWLSQYPPGQSALLALGLAAGAWWILNPLLVGLLAVATWRVARWCCGESTARLTLILLCLSPFVIAVAGSEMSHLPAATLAVGAAAFATLAVERDTLPPAALCGLLLGLLTAFRPLDAVAAAVPAGLILLWCHRRFAALAVTALFGILGTLPVLWFNARTTGSAVTFGYVALWGPQHSLGFHPVPWGVPLTFTRALARSGLDLDQLNRYLFDSTVPVLLIVAIGYVAGRSALRRRRDLIPFAGTLSLIVLLFFYWHRDVFYGPRFLYSAVAWFVILPARAIVLLRGSGKVREDGSGPGLTAAYAALAVIGFGVVTIAPGRIRAYRDSTPVFSLHPDRDAAAARIHHAVVVIPDGWGTRLIARMWAQGIPVRASSRLYAAIDACTLEEALAADELHGPAQGRPNGPAQGRPLHAVLDSLAALNRPGVPARVTDDPNLRLRPDSALPRACREEIEVDRRGFYLFAPFLWLNRASLDGDIVWARDLGPRNAALFRRYAGRRFYRYVPGGPEGAPAFLSLEGPGW